MIAIANWLIWYIIKIVKQLIIIYEKEGLYNEKNENNGR